MEATFHACVALFGAVACAGYVVQVRQWRQDPTYFSKAWTLLIATGLIFIVIINLILLHSHA